MKYLLVGIVLILVAYGQLIIKHETASLGDATQHGIGGLGQYLIQAMMNGGILSGLLAAFLAALVWIVALSKYELSSVYPLLSLSFVIVPVCSIYLFDESLNWPKGLGIFLTVLGVLIFSTGT